MTIVLKADSVTKRFGGVTALDDVTFDVNEGEIVGDIHAVEQVDVRANGRVIGNIDAARISISQGCFFEGEAHIVRH